MAGLAQVETMRKNYDKAEQLLKQATAVIPEVGFYEKLATVYKATNRNTEYSKTLEDVIAMMQDDLAHGHNMYQEFAHVYSDLMDYQTKALEYVMKNMLPAQKTLT